MDDKFYRHRARVLRELATEADRSLKNAVARCEQLRRYDHIA